MTEHLWLKTKIPYHSIVITEKNYGNFKIAAHYFAKFRESKVSLKKLLKN